MTHAYSCPPIQGIVPAMGYQQPYISVTNQSGFGISPAPPKAPISKAGFFTILQNLNGKALDVDLDLHYCKGPAFQF